MGHVRDRGHAWWGACVTGGVCGGVGHAWWGACMARGECMVGGMHGRGHAWWGGVHGRGHACVVGGACVAGGHAWQGGHMWQMLWDTVNERAVRLLLECILVFTNQFETNNKVISGNLIFAFIPDTMTVLALYREENCNHLLLSLAGISSPASLGDSLWSSQEPNYFMRNQDCAVVDLRTNKLRDEFCFMTLNGGPFPYICETGEGFANLVLHKKTLKGKFSSSKETLNFRRKWALWTLVHCIFIQHNA